MLAEAPEIAPKCLRALLSSASPETMAETAWKCWSPSVEFRLWFSKWEEKGKSAAQVVHENTLFPQRKQSVKKMAWRS